ncbi:MAG: phosphopantetheine-binding protein [Longimicrobiales bacterium]
MTRHGTRDRERFSVEMLAWLRTRLPAASAAIDARTPLFGPGMLDSIRVLELIAWTERAIGREIPDRLIRMDHFETVEAIARTFIATDSGSGSGSGSKPTWILA